MLPTLLRFSDLKARGVVKNRMTLHNWIERYGFPPGRLIGPNTRVWNEPDVIAWLEAQPTDRKPFPARS
jgi:predicted DNA-binding transcriptional regulator AlpA